jgi:hypothetical protein
MITFWPPGFSRIFRFGSKPTVRFGSKFASWYQHHKHKADSPLTQMTPVSMPLMSWKREGRFTGWSPPPSAPLKKIKPFPSIKLWNLVSLGSQYDTDFEACPLRKSWKKIGVNHVGTFSARTEIPIAKMLKFGVKLWRTLTVCGRAGSPRDRVESMEMRWL